MKTTATAKKRRETANGLSSNLKCLLILSVVLIVSSLDNNVRGNSRGKASNPSKVSVVATGTVAAMPDIVRMNISLSNMSSTTKEALEEVNKMVGQVLEVLKDFEVEDRNIVTTSLTFTPEYRNRVEVIGQNAKQTIEFSIHDIRNNDEKVSRIIARLVDINGIELKRIDFKVEDNSEYFVLSRELAYRNAVAKAEQYARLSGLKVVRMSNIWEEGSQSVRQGNSRSTNQSFALFAMPTMLPYGELEITTRITAEFLLE